MNPPESSENTLDVLVIGGGVQGLWLLNDLSKVGYNAILIEKGNVGGLQTIHSHGYLHQGYLYSDEQMARRLKGAEERWKTFCKNIDL
jgi:glycerol-3-phosphate dehydrogenase